MSCQILQGEVLEQLATLPEKSVHCCVTSPPYWGLRDYGVERQLGLKKTPEEFVGKMVAVFGEVWRVLRDDGTLWLNIGDSYAANSGSGFDTNKDGGSRKAAASLGKRNPVRHPTKPKDLCLIPERLALALQEDGWYVRSRIAWCKKSSMPESVRDRPTSSWEHIWLLTKQAKYFYDSEAVWVQGVIPAGTRAAKASPERASEDGVNSRPPEYAVYSGTANLRNYWLLGPEPYPDAHFATYPTEIPRRAILAGTSAKGCCPECGAPWVREVERTSMEIARSNSHPDELRTRTNGTMTKPPSSTTVGWAKKCSCYPKPLPPEPCTVLDPFLGSGTTCLVANELGRDSIGIELNPEYAEMAEKRIQAGLPLTQRTNNEGEFKLEFTNG